MISHARPLLDPRPAWCRVVALVGPDDAPTSVRTACGGGYLVADCETTETEPAERCGGCCPRVVVVDDVGEGWTMPEIGGEG